MAEKDRAVGVLVRAAALGDCEALAALAAQLGYPCAAGELRERLAALRQDAELNLILVAALADGRIVGWVQAARRSSLLAEPRVDVDALVVDERERGRGIGRLLMLAVEAWAKDRGLALIRLTSQTKRNEAHRFYERLGYEIKKTSHVLTKRL